MRTLIRSSLGSVAGAAAGYVVHQLMEQRDATRAERELIIGAPLVPALVAAAASLLTKRRGAAVAFLIGFGLTAALGTRLDDSIPGVAEARRNARAKIDEKSSWKRSRRR